MSLLWEGTDQRLTREVGRVLVASGPARAVSFG